MSEIFWSDEELIQAAEIIVENEFNELSRSLDEYYDYKADVKIVGSVSSAMFIGSIAMSRIEVEGWLEYPQAIATVGLIGMGALTALTTVQSWLKSHQARARLIE